MTDKVYSHLKRRYNEVYSVEPNTLHSNVGDIVFKRISGQLKSFPFKILVPLACVFAFLLYVMFDAFIVSLVSLLQYGF